jgi:hypothetical protein
MRGVAFRGARFDPRTRDMLTRVETLVGHRLRIAQGSWSTSTAASGQTHAGAAVDVATKYQGLSRAEKLAIVAAMRRVGFAAWLREETPGVWGEHIHGIPIGGPISPAAARQVEAYRHGYDGLAGEGGHRPDPQASLGIKPTTWEAYLRSLKPKSGRATVTDSRGAPVRREPGGHARIVRHRPKGSTFTYTAVRVVDDVAYLRTVAGNWVRSSRTSRGA